jgi:hypothetical protein
MQCEQAVCRVDKKKQKEAGGTSVGFRGVPWGPLILIEWSIGIQKPSMATRKSLALRWKCESTDEFFSRLRFTVEIVLDFRTVVQASHPNVRHVHSVAQRRRRRQKNRFYSCVIGRSGGIAGLVGRAALAAGSASIVPGSWSMLAARRRDCKHGGREWRSSSMSAWGLRTVCAATLYESLLRHHCMCRAASGKGFLRSALPALHFVSAHIEVC